MSNKPDRRKFIKNLSIGGLTAGIMPSNLFESSPTTEKDIKNEHAAAESPAKRNYNGPYTGEFLNRVAFPIGGIGAGM
ncbi:twin-arginine translocation signal domain-containing protein, partial [Rhizobium leguminosarum]|uniref:twin-arginine translocation signal domain-containing protein n=1 Tax=Rhizobium leguminosarum TaxID=384 RepID=UPI003F9D643D